MSLPAPPLGVDEAMAMTTVNIAPDDPFRLRISFATNTGRFYSRTMPIDDPHEMGSDMAFALWQTYRWISQGL